MNLITFIFMPDKKDILVQRLEAFGLDDNEAKVYLYLIDRGSQAGGSSIATATKLHRQYVYNALPHLIELNLVKEVPKGKQSRYIANPPTEIEKIGHKRALQASDLAHDLNFVSNIGNEQDFEIIQGARAVRQFEMNYAYNTKGGFEELIIGSASEGFQRTMGDSLDEYLAQKLKKEIVVKYIAGEREMESYKKDFGKYSNQQYRMLRKLPDGIANMIVRENVVAFYSYLNPPLIYIVKSEGVAKHYRNFFYMLWDMSEEV